MKSEELKSTHVCYGENVMMMRVDDCIVFGNKSALQTFVQSRIEMKDITHCKDCGYYAENYSVDPGVIVAHHICMKWGRGCITDPDGFCHYALKRGAYQDEHA